ncbi:MAG: hypothetical protein LIO85_02490 [Rikenellaceae bacterium]|nr:hypothetical protein [Rikenellaceae bacterium]
MKKLFLFLIIFSVAGLTSCLDSNETAVSELSAGVSIYNTAKAQVNLELDPLTIALKLNTLIETAETLGVDYTEAEIVVQEEDEDEDVEEETAKAVERLFGSGSVTRSGSVWTIVFNDTDALDKEQCYRSGTVVIETNGYTLTEIYDAGSMWEITMPGNSYDVWFPTMYTDKFNNVFDFYYIEPGDYGANSWNISGYCRSYIGTETHASSELSYTLINEGGGSFYYNDILAAAFYLSGYSEGNGVFSGGIHTRYEAKSVKYKPSCSLYLIYGGTETAIMDRSALALADFPSNQVKYNWYDDTASNSCGNAVEISYNGYTGSY